MLSIDIGVNGRVCRSPNGVLDECLCCYVFEEERRLRNESLVENINEGYITADNNRA